MCVGIAPDGAPAQGSVTLLLTLALPSASQLMATNSVVPLMPGSEHVVADLFNSGKKRDLQSWCTESLLSQLSIYVE